MNQEYFDGLGLALRELPDEDRDRITAAVSDLLEAVIDNEAGWQALDPKIPVSKGGTAFLWSDILGIGDAADVAGELLGDFTPLDAAKILLKMAVFWRQLRSIRVDLTREQFMVLRAVKKGNSDTKSIAGYTGLPQDTVDRVVSELQKLRYKEDIPLIETSEGGLNSKF